MAAALTPAFMPAAARLRERTRRHTALRLLPFLFALYLANYLDRTSVAYAAIGMTRELGFSDRVFGLGAGVFFISYVALQIPGALLVERWSARRMICLTMIAWGSMTALTALVHTPAELYIARFLLGAAEAGFFPGVIVYLSHWFICEDRAKVTSNFMSAIPLSFVIASPIAGLILGRSWFAIAGWRWLFVLEGLPAVLLGIIAFFYLTDLPGQAQWLAPQQRQWIENKLQEERSAGSEAMPIRQALSSSAILLLAAVCFLNYFAYYSFLFWLPTMFKRQSGFSDLSVGLLGALPYGALFLAMLVNGWHSDRHCERRWHCAVPSLIAAAGLLGLAAHPRSIPVLLTLFTVVTIGNAYLPALWAMPTELLCKSAAAASVGMINAVGSIAGFAGPYLFGYLNTKFASFSYGLTVLAITSLAAGLLVLRIPHKDASVRIAVP
ncbi:MAG TPA: MFS transporter [Candidatus Bathyarchaeia archaeon]|nr:MFS transporter [Candidatus Bathyarchaeia archaeon]